MAKRVFSVEILGDAKSIQNAFRNVGTSTSGLGEQFRQLGRRAAVMFTGLAVGAVALGKSLAESASDYGEAVSKSEQIFGDGAGAVLDFADGAAQALGQSRTAAIEAAATFGVFGKAAGLSGTDLAGFSTGLTGLASDLASFNNTSPEEAVEAIGAALRGESEPMRRFGVLLDDATLKARALDLGIFDGTGSLTQQQKVLAAQAEIYAQTADAQGDFARTSDGAANQQRILAAHFANLRQELGAKLLPVFTALLSFVVTRVIPGLRQLADRVIPPVQRAFRRAREVVEPLVRELADRLRPAVEAVTEWMRDHKETVAVFFGVLAGAVVLASIAALVAMFAALFNPITLIIGAIAAAAAGVHFAYTEFETFREVVDTVIGFVRRVFGDLVQWWRDHWDDITEAAGDAFDAVKEAVKSFAKFWTDRWDSIKEATRNVAEFFREIGKVIAGIWREFGDEIVATLRIAWDNIKGIVTAALKVVRGVIDLVLGILTLDWDRAWEGIKEIVDGIWEGIKTTVKTAISLIVTWFRGLAQPLKDAARSAFGGLVDMFRWAINKIIDLWNSIDIGFHIPKWIPKFGGKGVDDLFPDIPRLASGGIVTAPTLAVVGEAGPEAVVPLSRAGGMGNTYNVTVNAGLGTDGGAVGAQIVDAIRRYERTSGPGWRAA